jgi:hypothetical protein
MHVFNLPIAHIPTLSRHSVAMITVSIPAVDTSLIRTLVLPSNISIRPTFTVEQRVLDEVVGGRLVAFAELGNDLSEVISCAIGPLSAKKRMTNERV